MLYSASARGFFVPGLHNPIPTDAVEVTDTHYRALIEGQAAGKEIVPGTDGQPTLAPPTAAVPERVTMRQARLALLQAGQLDSVESALQAMTGDVGRAARIEWDFSSEVWRYKPFVLQLTDALGLSESQVDDLFIAAAAIT